MNAKILILLGVAAIAAADSHEFQGYTAPRASSEESYESYESSEAKYDFDWNVKDDSSGNDFGHQETRDGDNTQGSHYVLLPDTRRMIVTYYVQGDSGFVADVQYSGEARHPDSYESFESESRESYFDSNESK